MGRLTHTVSGSIATVRSPAVAPIESLKVHFSPIQEGTGDPSPSNVRPITGWTGVKLYSGQSDFNYKIFSGTNTNLGVTWVTDDNGKTTATGIPTSWSTKDVYEFDVNGDETIYGRIQGALNNVTFAPPSLYDSNGQALTGLGISDAALSVGVDLSQYNDVKKVRIRLKRASNDIEMNGKSCFVVASKTNQTNAPIQITFPVVGKNLFNKDAEPYQTGKYITDSVSGIPQYSNNAVYNVYRIPIKPATTYTFGPIKGGSSGSGPIWATMNANGITTRYAFNAGGSEGKYHTFTSYSSDVYLLLSVAVTNDYGYKCDNVLQVEEGSSATEYEAFDNTIYGGYVDLATGDVYKEYKRIVYDGSEDENWGKLTSGSATAFGMYMGASDKEKALYSDISSNYLKTISHNATWGNYDNWISDNVSEIATGIQSITTVSAWKEYLSEHNLVVCYKLKTPLKIATLTPQELATFKGYSNFWSNAGDVDVTYQVVESSEMTKERQKIFAGNAPTIHAVSGSVANFEMEPGLNRNLKSCKVGFLPVQEGTGDPFPPINQNGSIVGVNNTHNESELSSFKIHFSPIQSGSGDPSPTNVRPITGWTGVTGYKGGKNLLNAVSSNIVPFNDSNFSNYTLNDGNITMTDATLMGFKVKCKPSTKYTYSLSSSIDLFIEIGSFTEEPTIFSNNSTFIVNATASKSVTFTTRSDTEWVVCIIYAPSNLIDTSATASNFQLEVGSTATSYEPYSAPTSYPITFYGVGKNLFDQTKYSDTNNYPDSYNNYKYTDIITLKPNTTYTFASNAMSSITSGTYYVIFVNTGTDLYSFENKNFYYPVYNGNFSGTGVTNQFTTGSTGVIRFGFPVNEDITELMSVNWQLELGSSATIYEPFIDIIYGGYVDVVTGDVYKTHNKFKISDYNWRYISNGNVFTTNTNYTPSNMKKKQANTIYNEIKSDSYKTYSTVIGSWSNYSNVDDCIIGQYSPSDDCRIAIKDSRYTDPRVFKSEQGNVEIIYELATPVKVGTISPTNVPLTNGAIHSFWSNADAVTVETVGNVRPIKGWGGVNTHSSGKNLLNVNRPYGTPNPTTLLVPKRIMDTEHCYVGSHPDGYYVSYYSSGSVSNGVITVSSFPNNSYGLGFPVSVKGGQKYVFNVNSNDGTLIGTSYYDRDWNFIKNGGDIYPSMLPNKVLTTPDNAAYILIVFRSATNETYTYTNASLELGENGTSYESYSGNVYSVKFPVQGKNLLDVSNMTHGSYNIGSIPNILEPNTTYTFSVNGDTSKMYRLFATTEDFNTGVNYAISLNASYINKTSNLSFRTFTTPANIKDYPYLALAGNDSSAGNVPINDIKPQVELGSTATSYEPYDNSIFGGYVDLITGELTATYVCETTNGISWGMSGSGAAQAGHSKCIYTDTLDQVKMSLCTHWKNTNFEQDKIVKINHNNYLWLSNSFLNSIGLYSSNITSQNIEAYFTAQANNGTPVYVASPLQTPITYHLTPTQIQALKGTNNILSDANGTIEVKYWSH